MDTIEYTQSRFVLADKRSMQLIAAYTLLGASLVLLLLVGGLAKLSRYYVYGAILMAAGFVVLWRGGESTYFVLDRLAGAIEISRRPLLGKVQWLRMPLNEIEDVRTIQDESRKGLRFRVELLHKGQWVPVTRHFLSDEYTFQTLEDKIRGFLEVAPTT